LLNLTVNARDASLEGGVIKIAAREETFQSGHSVGLAAGRYVCIAVSDNGEGMDAETLARAAEPFFTTKGVGKGTGLGLSMVHGMAEQIGGRFVLNSSPGQGTTAEIWIPVAATKAAQGNLATQADIGSAPALKILAVDDDGLVLFNTIAMLEDLGHTALEARSGQEALDILEKNPVNLVITDQAMPQMSGMQLIAAIRERWPKMPVILATGYAELPAGATRDLLKLGKPFSETDLAGAIAKLFA
jgi:CheY-like chemotaxis protein